MLKQSLILSELDSLEHYFGQSDLNIEDMAAIARRHTFQKAEVVINRGQDMNRVGV